MNILVIRGGALGDFIVTLPTLRLLRERWPDARIEVLGQPRLAEIALQRHYLNGVRSVNHGPLSAFFTPRAVLDPAWMDYIGDFDLVLSYFYDPDGLFLANLKRCNPVEILTYSPRVPDTFDQPAARHFAGMVEPLGLKLADDVASDLFPRPEDVAAARAFVAGLPPRTRLVAIHPGSGGETKNWPVESWAELGRQLVRAAPDLALLIVEGEADGEQARVFDRGVERTATSARALAAAADSRRAFARERPFSRARFGHHSPGGCFAPRPARRRAVWSDPSRRLGAPAKRRAGAQRKSA